MTTFREDGTNRCRASSLTIAVLMLAAVALFYVLREHWGHLLGAWPYLLLVACPLIHLMHRERHRHGGDGAHGHRADDARPSQPPGVL